MQFAEFLQHSSLKRLGILYHPTCVGLGYGLNVEAISWMSLHSPLQSNKRGTIYGDPSHFHWPTNINVVPIDYAFLPRLRGRLTLLRLALSRKP